MLEFESAKRNFSGASHSTTLSENINPALSPEQQSCPPLAASESPSEILKRSLSVTSVVSNRARGKAPDVELELRVIGVGSCGTVFEIPGTELAYKKGSDVDAMWKDFRLTNAVHAALGQVRRKLQAIFANRTIPRSPMCHEFVLPDSADWWTTNSTRFPQHERREAAVFLVDRILSLPQHTREALIKMYFEDGEEIQREAMNDAENQHCLVRVYLGERERPEQQAKPYDSLRNFPLRLNMMEDLGLDTSALATEMGIGLAVVHWQAQVDAMDMEFVLGSAATTPAEVFGFHHDTPPQRVYRTDLKTRSTHLWMLDFDKAHSFHTTGNDVDKKLVPAFLGNDPYYPRPDVDEALWNDFTEAYLAASKIILKGKGAKANVMALPQRFLDKVVEMIKEHEDWNPEEDIVFGC